MNGKNCRATRLEIDQSELGQHLSDQVLQHLASCPPCSEFRAQRGSLRELIGGLEPVVAPADFDVQLRARIAREKENRARRSFIFRFVISTPAIAVAALLVMIVGTIVWVSQRNRISTVASTTSARP